MNIHHPTNISTGATPDPVPRRSITTAFCETGQMSEMYSAALVMARRGFPVFPCTPEKKPYTKHGFKDASTNAAQIRSWFQRWPDALLGMPTGKNSGVVVLDIDEKNGKQGIRNLTNLHGVPPCTLTVSTMSGGLHLFYDWPGHEVKCNQDKIAKGVDVRGDGGYVIIPPSPSYTPDILANIATLPDWVTETELLKPFSDALLLCNSATLQLCYSVSHAIELTLPREGGSRNRAVFNFARALKFECGMAGKPPSELKPLLKQWHERALPVIRTKDFASTWADFLHAWDKVKSPLSSAPVQEALNRARAEPPVIPDIGLDDEDSIRIYGLVYWLAKLGGGRFFLSCHDVEKHMGIDNVTAWRRMKIFEKEGLVEVVEMGVKQVKATRYRWTGVAL
jgi:hypothetical protein